MQHEFNIIDMSANNEVHTCIRKLPCQRAVSETITAEMVEVHGKFALLSTALVVQEQYQGLYSFFEYGTSIGIMQDPTGWWILQGVRHELPKHRRHMSHEFLEETISIAV